VTIIGRTTKLDEATARVVIDALKVGCPIRVACQAAGVDGSMFKTWMVRGKSGAPEDAPYRPFRADVKKAGASGEAAALQTIREATPQSWQAAVWLLERSRPERWGHIDRVKENVEPRHKPNPLPRSLRGRLRENLRFIRVQRRH
jgi:hypothetical protein